MDLVRGCLLTASNSTVSLTATRSQLTRDAVTCTVVEPPLTLWVVVFLLLVREHFQMKTQLVGLAHSQSLCQVARVLATTKLVTTYLTSYKCQFFQPN